MSKTLLALITLVSFASCSFIRSHNYWYTDSKGGVKADSKDADLSWNYCDLKCLYLERYYPKYDFVFITFSQPVPPTSTPKPNFGVCYIRINAFGVTYFPWTQLATNTWFDTYCGKETQDYYLQSLKANSRYKMESIEGEGIGTQPNY